LLLLLFWFGFCYFPFACLFVWRGSCCIAQAGLELTVLMGFCHPSGICECFDYIVLEGYFF
jgi:hypothetical protein